MHKLIWSALIAGAVFGGGYAAAQIVSALPFQLQNNTVADATQVMANFNQILNGVNANGAKNGANSDITALLGLTTPLAPSVGGTTVFTGGASGGSANAQTVASVVPSTFTLVAGSRVVFVAGFTNTTAVTLNVAGSGVKNVYRQTQFGPAITSGAEIFANSIVEVIYDGTEYQIVSPPVVVGQIVDYGGVAIPPGWALADGSCLSATTYPLLNTLIQGTFGSCSAGQFALPDYQGRVSAGVDTIGRIATVCSGSNTLGVFCGVKDHSLAAGELPASPPTGTVSTPTITISGGTIGAVSTGVITLGGGTSIPVNSPQAIVATSSTPTFTGANLGSGTAFSIVQPTLIVKKIIKL